MGTSNVSRYLFYVQMFILLPSLDCSEFKYIQSIYALYIYVTTPRIHLLTYIFYLLSLSSSLLRIFISCNLQRNKQQMKLYSLYVHTISTLSNQFPRILSTLTISQLKSPSRIHTHPYISFLIHRKYYHPGCLKGERR